MASSHGFSDTTSLFTYKGERKYLTPSERKNFYDALDILTDFRERFFCEMIYWTGCRPSEALALNVASIGLDEMVVIIRSLKKRGKQRGRIFRLIPLPCSFVKTLNDFYSLRSKQFQPEKSRKERLFPFSRTKGWQLVKAVMEKAGISGAMACARGLRHSFGVKGVLTGVPITMIQKWLGHTNIASTQIYLDLLGPEERQIAQKMWA